MQLSGALNVTESQSVSQCNSQSLIYNQRLTQRLNMTQRLTEYEKFHTQMASGRPKILKIVKNNSYKILCKISG